MADRVEVGRIVGLHGVRGGLRIESWTDPRPMIFQYRPWTLVGGDGGEREFAGARGQVHGKGLLAELPEVTDRDQAQALLGARIFVPRAALPALAADEFYWTDLEGLMVVTTTGVPLGTVSHLFATGANDVMVVRGAAGQERLVPYVTGRFVKQVDLEAARIVVDWDPDF